MLAGDVRALTLSQVFRYLPSKGCWFAPAYRGPGGLFAVRVAGFKAFNRRQPTPPMYQVVQLDRIPSKAKDVSLPFLTLEGAGRLAEKMAKGGDAVK